MARKLTDDQIRFIIDVDAKGVQAELKKVISSTFDLEKANKQLKEEIAAAEKQMKEALKEMKQLEKQGLETSKAYEQYEDTLESARADVEDYTRKLTENNKAIAENEKKHAEIIKTMDIEDMTMTQLTKRASDLQWQLDNTSQSLSPEAYAQLNEELVNVRDRMTQVDRATQALNRSADIQNLTMDELKSVAKDLQEQLDNTSLATNPERYAELQRELRQVNNRMEQVGNTNKSMLQQFAGMHNPVGSAAKAILGFGQALKLLLQNKVIFIISLIVGLFVALRESLFKNEEAMNAINRILAPMKLLFDAIVNVLQKLVIGFLNFTEAAISGISKMLEKIPLIGKAMGKVNEKAQEAIKLEKDKQALQVRQREQLVVNAEKELEIAKLRTEAAKRDQHSATERMEMLDKAIELEKQIVQEKVNQAKETLRLLELEAKRNESSTELLQKIAEARANVFNTEKEYYTTTKRMEGERASASLQNRREEADAAKKAMENRLKEIDKTLDYEKNQLKTSRMQGLLTEKEYNDEVEKLSIEALHKKINIKGQEKHKIIQYESEILDAQIKQQEAADAILLDMLKREQEKQLQLLEVSKNAQLEKLQEEESDRAIYALRAAEIEASIAEARLDVIRQSGEAIQQAEFSNNQNRLDAIESNKKEIIAAETKTIKGRENLHKLFMKTTADFERQYNIRTWEQRRDDELNILQKQYEAGLLSLETKKIAETVIEKKYEDEKLKIREQYGLVSMKEQYNAEMEALTEQLANGTIEIEDAEKARLQIKLKYAQEYAQKAAEFASMASDAISSIQSAEIVNTEAKYDAEIQAAGDNKEEVERLENEKAKKKLDIEKKYADVQFAVTAAEIISNTAMAVMKALAQLGPIAGPIAAALMGVTGVAQLAIANTQRQKVRQMTLSGASSSPSAPKTGEIRLKEGFAEGGSNTDLTQGGYTGDGDKYDVAGYVPIHHGEYVVATDELRYPDVAEKVRAIEKIRRKRTNKNPLPEGFAEGGANINSQTSSFAGAPDTKSAERIAAILERLENGDIVVKTNYGITEMEAMQREKIEAESNFTIES